jgi:signal transduction histidine kinase
MHRARAATVLIVDDEIAHQRILTQMLAAEGYRVASASSGAAALALARHAPPDLIILDVGLPDVSGHSVCQQMKDEPALSGTPIIFMSGAHELHSKLTAFTLGAVDYIDKPFHAAEVLARVNTHITMHHLRLCLVERTVELQHANTHLGEALAAKDEFLTSMSHELRTPLNAILGLAEILNEGIYGPLDARQRQAVQTVAANGQHLLSLINDILDLAKIAAGHEQLTVALVAPAELCAAAVALVQEWAHVGKVTLLTELGPALAPIMADARRVTQILVNLLANAIKFTPPGGQVGLELVAVGAEAVRLTVWDTGAGIPSEQIGRLFRAFTQLEGGLQRQAGSTGLGLALVAHLARMHGGSVALTSAVGVGSRFSVTLPLTAPAHGADESVPLAPGAPLVLVIDDYAPTADDLAASLREAGYACVQASSADAPAALALAPDSAATIVALPMGDLQGEETLRRLRGRIPAGVPLVAIGAVLLPDSAARAAAAGADVHLGRPVTGGALAATLARLLGERAPRPQG